MTRRVPPGLASGLTAALLGTTSFAQQFTNVGGVNIPNLRVVLASASDNAGFEYFRTASGTLTFAVNGVVTAAPAAWAGGNVWRATIPGYWFGDISYSIAIRDRAGNQGTSPVRNVTIPSAGIVKYGSATSGCGASPRLNVNSAPTIANADFAFVLRGCPPNSFGQILVTNLASAGADVLGIGVALWVDPFASTETQIHDVAVNAGGQGFAAAPTPTNPAIVGNKYFCQALVANSSCAAAPIVATGALDLTILP